jgi:hypothetical protein
MQELSRIESASVQNTSPTKLGCSAHSALPTETNNHDSLQQHLHIQTSKLTLPDAKNSTTLHVSAASSLSPAATAFDPITQKLYAVMHEEEESKTEQ